MVHKHQGTGNYKGKRDKHEKTEHNKAKQRPGWTDLGKKTNSDRNKNRHK
ncbi:MAG: hypothetical protein WCL18_10560 [bacterium]